MTTANGSQMRATCRRPVLGSALVIAALVAACASPAQTAQERPAPAETAAPAEGGGDYPVSVENCGRTLTFEEAPRRVVTGYQPVLETMIALGLQDRIVGRVNFEENGPEGYLPGQKAVYDAIPEISDSIVFPSKEVMLSQDADFVIDVSAMSSFDPAGGQATVEELDAAGAQVYVTGGWCSPEEVLEFQIADTLDDVRNLGAIFGVPDRAEALVADLQATLDDVEERVAGRDPVRVLVTDGGEGPVNAYGGAGLTNQMVTLAGGENALADVREDYTEVSAEQVAASQPEALIVSDYTVYFGEELPGAETKAESAFAIARDSPAARERRFLALPVAAQHPGYRNVQAIADIARFLHPDAFAADG